MKDNVIKKLFETVNRIYDERQMLENVCLLFAAELSCHVSVMNKEGRLIFENDDQNAPSSQNNFNANELFTKVSYGANYIGTITVRRQSPEFDNNDAQIFYAFASVLGLLLRFMIEQDKETSERIKAAIGSLSYSELTAALYVFEEILGESGTVISSNISKQKGVAKSVIVNCLKKLESAGFIDVRSLGVKGTHIRVLNEAFVAELNKLKN